MFRGGGWCEAAARTVDVSAGSVCIQKGRWLSLSSPFIDSRLRERTTPFVKYLFIFRNGTDASWKLPAVALWWLSFSPSSFFQWGTQKRNFVSFRYDCNLFWLLFHRFLFDARFSVFLVGVCTVPPPQQVESESLGRKLNVSNGGRLTGIALSVVGRSSPRLCWNRMAAE